MSNVLTFALEYLRRGYVPVYIQYAQKFPRWTGWQVADPTTESLTRQFSRPANLGIRMGDVQADGSCLIALDVDLEEHQLIRCVEHALGVQVPVKRGKKGCTYIFRLDREYKTHKLYWTRGGKKTAAVDVLCCGAQTVVPPSIHPDTNQPYQWVAGTPLDQIDYGQLPVFTPAVIDEVRGFCKNDNDPIYALNDMEWLGVGGGGTTHDVCVAAVASMVTRAWSDEEIQERVDRAKRRACESAGSPYDWPQAQKVIQGWIESARAKFPAGPKRTKVSHGSLAEAFLRDVRPNILYDWDRRCWFAWTTHWEGNKDPFVRHAIEQWLPPEARNRAMVEGIEKSLRDRPELRISSEMWDPDPHLLNTPAGTVDLKTAQLRPASPSDLITRITAVAPDFNFSDSVWASKLPEWFGNDTVELNYVQDLWGYTCSGETREHCLPLWIGPGGDGKSVITGACAYALGTYAGVATDTAFLDTRHSQHSEEIAMLHGFRLVRVSEMSGLWREDRIKQVTGGECITASFKNAHLFTFTPRFKLFVTANEAPRVKSVGKDMKRRFHVLKFTRPISAVDRALPEKLRAEASKVLGWMIMGAKRYYANGLSRSPAVEAATSEYFSDNDTTEQWIEECACLGENLRVEQTRAYESFRECMEANGQRFIPTRVQFQNRLIAKGIVKKNAVVNSGQAPVPALIGITLKVDLEDCRF